MTETRLEKLNRLILAHNLDCVVVIPGSSMAYLTGLNFHLMERPTVAFFPKEGLPALVAPGFECSKIAQPEAWRVFPWRDEDGPAAAFEACCRALNLAGKRVGAEELSLRYKEYSLLTTFAPGVTVTPADALIAAMRSLKDADEIARMKAAVVLAETALAHTVPLIKIGMMEKEVAAELVLQMFRAGSESLPFEPLIQTGPSGASPHAGAGDRRLAAGDMLIMDFGARLHGYVSDITRTFAVGEPDAQSRRIYDLVQQANQAGRAAAGPGVPCQDVDRAARKVIEAVGYGTYFNHRTGHGLGIDGHESPYIVEGNAELLQPGATFTVEPGIYIPDWGGVRIEDDMVITRDGAESLTTFSRDLMVVG